MDGGRSRPCLANNHDTSSSRRGGIGLTDFSRGTGSVAIFFASNAGIERRIAGQQLVRECAETIDVVGGTRGFSRKLLGAGGER